MTVQAVKPVNESSQTTDEFVLRMRDIYRELGYLILCSMGPLSLGTILRPEFVRQYFGHKSLAEEMMRMPLRVVSASDKFEATEFYQRVGFVGGTVPAGYFYRVQVCD